jgi:type IV secretory pathway TraG/TraD family ATPase VirD4
MNDIKFKKCTLCGLDKNVDEFQNFATSAFADILSEARKYKLALIMAHQYIAQLNE